MTKLSVITINLNNALGLENTIKSVINQTYNNFEYIVIDGNSTDGSIDIIKKYADKISYWISEPDSGIYNAMNKGIRQAKGEYLNFLNSGDCFFDPNTLSTIFQGKKYSAPILRGVQVCVEPTGDTFRWNNFGNRDLTLYDFFVDGLRHQATFISNSLFKKYGLYDEKYKIVSDWKFFIECMLHGETSRFIDLDIILFDMTGISNDPKWQHTLFTEREAVLKEIIPPSILSDLNELKALKEKSYFPYDYITTFITENKLPRLFFRIINKIYKIFKL